MPQIFQVLKCYKCLVFQVHQTKKSNKWECKLCGEKQSIKRHYGLGTGKECRLHVQKLNGIRGEMDQLNESIGLNKTDDEEEDIKYNNSIKTSANSSDKTGLNKESKWLNFIEKTDDNIRESDGNESMYFGTKEVVLQLPVKKRRLEKPFTTHKDTTNTTKINYFREKEETDCYGMNIISNSNTFSKEYNSTKPNSVVYKPSVTKIDNNIDNADSEVFNGHELTKKHDHDIKMQPKKVETYYIPPKINKNSKWAQFTDETCDENEIPESISKIKPLITAPQELFSLCDESELDDVLNF